MLSREWSECQGALKGTELRVTERAQNADFRRKPQIFADSPFSWKFQHLEGAENRRFSQKTEDFRRKLQETADWAPSP